MAAIDEVPERVLGSPALRAQQTVELARRAGSWACAVEPCEALYGEVGDVLEAIRHRGGNAERLLVVGHEPTWSSLAAVLAHGCQFRLPTASVLRLDFTIDEWSELEGDATVRWLVIPRLLDRTG